MDLLIPEMVNAFEAYLGPEGSARMLGLVDADLPNINFMTREIKGAGLGGSINAPVLGQTESMELVMHFRSVAPTWLGTVISSFQLVSLMGNIQGLNPATGLHGSWPTTILATGLIKSKKAGRLEVGETMGSELVVEVTRYSFIVAAAPIVLVDKLNYLYQVMGKDVLGDIRKAVGLLGFGDV